MRHGTRYSYVKGWCRCEACIEANRRDNYERRQKRIARAALDPSIIPHGGLGYRDYGCRCEVCAQGRREDTRKQRGSQPATTWTEEEIARAVHVYATEGYTAAGHLGIAHATTILQWARLRGVPCFERDVVHGRSRYSLYGCRCEVCVSAYQQEMKRTKAERISRQSEAPHGTATAYTNWGCRCDPCKKAGSIQNAETRRRRLARQALTGS